MWSALSLALLLVSIGPISSQLTEPGLSKMDELRYQTMLTIDQLWQDFAETNDISGNSGQADDALVWRVFQKLCKNISRAGQQIENSEFGPLSGDLEVAQLTEEAVSMETFFETFRRHQSKPIRWRHELAWTDLAQYFLESTDKGVNKTMDNLHKFTLTRGDSNMFQKILQDSKGSMCELQQSQQELIYQMYKMVALAELKGYTMLQFAWMLLKIYDKGNFTAEADLMRKLYTERTLQKVNAAREAMNGADRSLYRCDPRKWEEGDTYVRLTKLLQGYIENEVNLNPEGTCGQNCKFYDVTKYYGCFKNQFCAQQRQCAGSVLHCTYYDSDMNICKSESSDRRYDWIEYENKRVLGAKGSCPNRNLVKVDSWWRYLFWHCSYCFCLCDDNHASSDRYFNLRQVKSDIESNKVVTGVRFVKEKQVVHIQIQQGLLEERGVVNQSSTAWLPVQSYSVMDNDAINGIDYHTMNARQRTVDLDDSIAPATHVLTGARFRLIGHHLNLEVMATPFDFQTGKLDTTGKILWIGNDNTDGSFDSPRTQVNLPDPDVPTRRGPHIPDSKHDQFIQFRESSLSMDASQSTVPYLDAQPVDARGQVLSGLGLHHRGGQRSGGLLALKVITYDFSPHMVPQTPTLK